MNIFRFFRNSFLKNRVTNLLSIGGLSLGIAIALVLGWWAINEMKFDRFNDDADQIYRVCREGFLNNETVKIGTVFGPVSRVAKENLPQIQESIRITTTSKERFQVGELINYEESIYLADSNFFQFFSFLLQAGFFTLEIRYSG